MHLKCRHMADSFQLLPREAVPFLCHLATLPAFPGTQEQETTVQGAVKLAKQQQLPKMQTLPCSRIFTSSGR